jgi:LPS O-antigen subunit length determinant protein (WzzB/FepE family)
MESNLRIYKEQVAAVRKEPQEAVATQRNEKLAEAEREIQGWENQLNVMRQHYKDSHPDVQVAMGRLAVAKQRRDGIQKEEDTKKSEPPAPRPVNLQSLREAREMEANVQRMESAIEAKDAETRQYNKDLQRTNDGIRAFQSRIETVPLGEKQYADLLRDRDIAKQKYIEREEKLNRARLAREMEDRKQGEMLEQLDPASLPMTPTEPKRPLIISIGAGLGLVLGVVIAGAREMKDTSLKNLKDVRAYTQMAVLGSIPLLENDFVVRRRKRLAWLGWTTACLAGAVIISGSIVYYYVTKV